MKALQKNRYREILRSPGRFFAILGIIVLGSGFFVGLRVSQQAMINTADQYLTEQNFYDFSISNTLGLTEEDVEVFADTEGVLAAEGSVSVDALVTASRGAESVAAFYSLPSSINLPKVTAGRLPEAADECLADSQSGFRVGDVITVSASNEEDTLEMFAETTFTVVGTATSPLYLNYERGNTSLGSGSIDSFVYIPSQAFDVDYYTTVYLRMEDMPSTYSEAYDQAADQWEDPITDLAEERAAKRYHDIVEEAEAELADGQAEYEEGKAEYETERADAEQELGDAWAELEDARVQIEDGKAELEEGWAELNKQVAEGEAELKEAEDALQEAREQLEDGEAEYESGLAQYEDGLAQYEDGLAEYEDKKAAYEDGLAQYQDGLKQYQDGLAAYQSNQAKLEESKAQLDAGHQQLTEQQEQFDTLLDTLATYATDSTDQTPLYEDGAALLTALRDGDEVAVAGVNQALAVLATMPEYADQVPGDADELLAQADALEDGWATYEEGLAAYEAGKAELEEQEGQLAAAQEELTEQQGQFDTLLDTLAANLTDPTTQEPLYQDGAALLTALRDGDEAAVAGVNQALAVLAMLPEYADQVPGDTDELLAQADALEAGWAAYEEGLAACEAGKAELEAQENQFAAAEEELTERQGQFDTLLDTLAANITDTSAQPPLYEDGASLLAALRAGDETAIQAVDQVLSMLGMLPEYADQVPQDTQELLSQADALDAAWASYEEGLAAYQSGAKQLASAKKQLDETNALLKATKTQLDNGKAQLDSGWETLEDARRTLEDSAQQLEEARAELDDGWATYEDGYKEWKAGWDELNAQVADATRELEEAEAELADAQETYEEGLQDYQEAKEEAEEQFADAEAELADAYQELLDARAEIDDIKRPTTYALGRESNVGYACFESDTSIVKSISGVFPVFFFLVAALICITTITRMVDEQRSQLGVFMALGYGKLAIMNKFFFYSGSATVLGCVIGILFGSWIIPRVVWSAYAIMYSFSENILYCFGTPISAAVFVAYLASMLLVTWLACRKEMRDTPANIIRPKAPKAGKRVLLERIPFLWNHLSFMWKVTLRNLFRYKQRVFMMVLGIGGCTALMITGFGIRDSIQHIVDFQYSEITYYDLAVTFDEAPDEAEQAAFVAEVGDLADGTLFARQSAVTAVSEKREKSAYLTVVEDTEAVRSFVDLHTGEEPLDYPGLGEVLVNTGLAESLQLEVGDTLSIRSDDESDMTFTVSGIFDNYIDNYLYISADTYAAQSGNAPEINTAFLVEPEDGDDEALTAYVLGMDNVLYVSASSEIRERIDSMMVSLIYIVILTIVCAAALAFIVIYNLTNINITERFREIATVKVLGFYQWESAIYVLRENIVLTIAGALVGIPMGIWLNTFIIEQIKVDMINFTPRIALVSFVYALLLTFVFSVLVDLFMYVRLSKINTAEALKAAE